MYEVLGISVYIETQGNRDKEKRGRENQVLDTDFVIISTILSLKHLSLITLCSHIKKKKETFLYQAGGHELEGKSSG